MIHYPMFRPVTICTRIKQLGLTLYTIEMKTSNIIFLTQSSLTGLTIDLNTRCLQQLINESGLLFLTQYTVRWATFIGYMPVKNVQN